MVTNWVISVLRKNIKTIAVLVWFGLTLVFFVFFFLTFKNRLNTFLYLAISHTVDSHKENSADEKSYFT